MQFQSTLPRGERHNFVLCNIIVLTRFNPRSRAGSDVAVYVRTVSKIVFQSTLPRGERLTPLFYTDYRKKFQSTLPRGERLFNKQVSEERMTVSIHAPARGATPACIGDAAQNCRFNPRSRAGSDYLKQSTIFIHAWFQSTLPRGERHVSNHPSTKLEEFQSTLPRGERHLTLVRREKWNMFQSTLPRGERRVVWCG